MDRQFAIFDLDGTLVDSMPYWQGTIRHFLTERGVTEELEPVLEEVKPLTVIEAARLMIGRFGFPDDPEKVNVDITASMAARYRTSIPLKDGVEGYLEALHRRSVRMCVASATGADLMEACLTRLGVRHYFEFVISCIDVGVGKDRPDIYFAAARRLGAAPDEIAVYEDSPNAMRTAKRAGFYGVGVYDPQAAVHWEEMRALADERIADWREGLRMLEQNS